MSEPIISYSHESEVAENQRICEIRFDCVVTMFESGFQTTGGNAFFLQEKSLPPQWFKSQHKLTLEGIKHADEYTIGRTIKLMLHQLEKHIEKYENRQL